MVELAKRIWRGVNAASTLWTVGGVLVTAGIVRALTRLPTAWVVVCAVGLALLVLGAFRYWQQSASIVLRPYSHGELLRLEVINSGATSQFEAAVLDVEIVGASHVAYPGWQVAWAEETGRRSEIPHGASQDLAIGHAAGGVNAETGTHQGNVEFFRASNQSNFNVPLGFSFAEGATEIRIRVRVTRVRPARSLVRSYSIRWAPAPPLPQHQGAVWPVFAEVADA